MRGAYPRLTDSLEVAAANTELHRGEEDAADLFSTPANPSDASSLALLMVCECGHELGWHTQWDQCTYCRCSRFALAEEEIA